MSIQKVRAYFQERGMADRIREFDVSSATVELAAVAVGVEGARIAKSLSFKVEDHPVIVVAAGDAKVDNGKYKAQFHTKAKMLTPDEVVAFTGHAVGGVCPFAIENPAVTVWLDRSLARFETVYPAAGSSNSAIELTLKDLETFSRAAGWVDVCKGWQEGV